MMTTPQPVYETAAHARDATSEFYEHREGFAYSDETVAQWLDIYLTDVEQVVDLSAARILDLCCGDGIWSRGLKTRHPGATLHGIDIAPGGIEKARSLVGAADEDNFVVGDAEDALPWPEGHFDLIFARGPGLYNQHSMDRHATIGVLEMWHRHLKPGGGVMVSAFYSKAELFGTYTNPLSVALPYNRAPRLTDAVDFTGGKYHHDIQSFLTPFWKAGNVKMGAYRFVRNTHVVETRAQSSVVAG